MATEPANGRNVVVGLAVTVSRAGVSAGRTMLWPVRAVESLPFVRGRVSDLAETGREAELESRRRLEGAAENLLATPEAERALDSVLAGPLPESVSRSLVQHQVVERVARETLSDRQTDRIVATILASPEFDAALHRVVSSPALREALTQQTETFTGELVATLRQRAARGDDRLERKPHSLAHRAVRPVPHPYAGLVSRGSAFAVDLLVVALVFVTASALAGLASTLVGGFRPHWLAATIAGAFGLVLEVLYFAGFWSFAGQTPGMRLLGLRVVAAGGRTPGFGRALLRVCATWLAIVPLGLGLLPMLVDDRRRALQDYIAGTAVIRDSESLA